VPVPVPSPELPPWSRETLQPPRPCLLQLCPCRLCCTVRHGVCAGVVLAGLAAARSGCVWAPADCPAPPCTQQRCRGTLGARGTGGAQERLWAGAAARPSHGCPCEGLAGLRTGALPGVPVRGWQDCARGHCPAPSARGVRGGGEQDCTAGALEGEVKPWLSAVALGH